MAELFGKTPVVTYNRMLRRSLQLVADANDINIHASTMQSFVWNDYAGDLPVLVRSPSDKATATSIANELRNRAGSIGVIVSQNATGDSVCELLSNQLKNQRVDKYSNRLQNEDDIDVRATGVTVLSKESVKGQEFDTVFILELEDFIPCTNDAEFRAMYMMCTRARDRLYLVHGPQPLSREARAALPDEDVLER